MTVFTFSTAIINAALELARKTVKGPWIPDSFSFGICPWLPKVTSPWNKAMPTASQTAIPKPSPVKLCWSHSPFSHFDIFCPFCFSLSCHLVKVIKFKEGHNEEHCEWLNSQATQGLFSCPCVFVLSKNSPHKLHQTVASSEAHGTRNS